MWMMGRSSARQAASKASTISSAPSLLRGPKRGSPIACCRSISRRTASHGRRMKILSARREDPEVEIKDHGGIIVLADAQGKVRAGTVLGRRHPQAQSADVVPPGQRRAVENFAPGEHGVAGEQRRDMAPAVDRGDVKGVGEAIEAQRARQRNDVPAIDQPASETALALAELIEIDLAGVLKQAR